MLPLTNTANFLNRDINNLLSLDSIALELHIDIV